MKSAVLSLALAALLAPLAPADASAQNTKIPAGTYLLVADSGFVTEAPLASISLVVSDSTMTANVDGRMVIVSKLVYAGTEVTLVDVEGEMACGSPARYEVAVKPNGVRLTPISDECAQRSMVLIGVTLVKS